MTFVGFVGFSLKTSQNAKVLRLRGLRKKCMFYLPNITGALSILLEGSLKKKLEIRFALFLRKLHVFYGTSFLKFPAGFLLENQHFSSKWPRKRFWPILAGWGARSKKNFIKNNLCYFFELRKKYWVSDPAQF